MGRQCCTGSWDAAWGRFLFLILATVSLCFMNVLFTLWGLNKQFDLTWLGLRQVLGCWTACIAPTWDHHRQLGICHSWLLCRYSTCILVQDEESTETNKQTQKNQRRRQWVYLVWKQIMWQLARHLLKYICTINVGDVMETFESTSIVKQKKWVTEILMTLSFTLPLPPIPSKPFYWKVEPPPPPSLKEEEEEEEKGKRKKKKVSLFLESIWSFGNEVCKNRHLHVFFFDS